MNVRYYTYMVIALFGIHIHSYAQTTTTNFEDAYMKCYEDGFKDNGKAIRGFLQKSEQFLIDRNILKDTTAKSYKQFLNNSRAYTDTPYSKFGFIGFVIQQVQKKNFSISFFRECKDALKTLEGYEDSKLFLVEETLSQITELKDVQDVTTKVADILSDNDLAHMYYRLRIINFLQLHGRRNKEKPFETPTLSKTELENALKIYIKAQDEILLNNASVSFGELLKKTEDYLKNNTSKSVIAIKAGENISAQFSTALKLEIKKIVQSLRDQLAQKKYNISFEELTTDQQQDIKKTYPYKIILK